MGYIIATLLYVPLQVVFGLLGATISTAQIYLIPAFILRARATELEMDRNPFANAEDGTRPFLDRILPTSPALLRAIAFALICVALLVGILGTTSDIFSTWIAG